MSSTPQKVKTSSWWLDRLEGVQRASDGWTALCPAHNDLKRSLSLKELPNGEILVHCFAGCEYKDILEALEEDHPVSSIEIRRTPPSTASLSKSSPGNKDKILLWWEEYTFISQEEWEEWGVVFTNTHVNFTWESSPVTKSRLLGEKKFTWSGTASPPPLWPEIPKDLSPEIWLTEGETDCGVLRHLGFSAFSITKGALTPLSSEVWEELYSRGARTIILAFDSDSAGEDGTKRVFETLGSTTIDVLALNLRPLLNPLLGEKDLRDLFRRNGDDLQESLRKLANKTLHEKKSRRKLSLEDFLAQSIEEVSWLVEGVWLNQSTGLISGPPKSGKSWLALDLGISVATGTPFLGRYPVERPGPVALITSEDPDPLLQDRFKKILIAKGLGGSSEMPTLTFPKSMNIPFHLDLDRDFTFSPEGTDHLMKWLYQIRDRYGRLSLVIIDPILRFLPTGLDEYKASEVAASIFQTTSRIYKEFGAGVILVHHKSKGGVEGKGSYGSIAFGAFAESALYLTPTSDNTKEWVNVVGEYKSAVQSRWSYRFPELDEKYKVEIQEDEVRIEKAATSGISKTILEVLSHAPEGMTVGELVGKIPQGTEYVIRMAVKSLAARHQVEQAPNPDRKGPGPKADRWIIKQEP